MGFDIALMGRFGLEGVFDNKISFGKAFFHIAVAAFEIARNVGAGPFGHGRIRNTFADDRRIHLDGFVHIRDVGQNLIGDLYGVQRHRAPRAPM